MTINGIHLLFAIFVIVSVYLFVHYLEWKRADKDRRLQRSAHVNLMRATGGPR
jgi:regulatory protein YycI of two-component signal transduction system YycFG